MFQGEGRASSKMPIQQRESPVYGTEEMLGCCSVIRGQMGGDEVGEVGRDQVR